MELQQRAGSRECETIFLQNKFPNSDLIVFYQRHLLIVNITPVMQHYDIIKASLEAGKHVFTEKVIIPDFHKTAELMELVRSKKLYLCSEPDHFLGSSWQPGVIRKTYTR